MSNPTERLAKRVVALRKAAVLPQREAAQRAGIPASQYRRLEEGGRTTAGSDAATLRRLATVLGAPPDDLVIIAGLHETAEMDAQINQIAALLRELPPPHRNAVAELVRALHTARDIKE